MTPSGGNPKQLKSIQCRACIERVKISCVKAEGELDTAIAPLYTQLANISEFMKNMSDKQDRMFAENASLSSQVEKLFAENAQLKTHLADTRQELLLRKQKKDQIMQMFQSPHKGDGPLDFSDLPQAQLDSMFAATVDPFEDVLQVPPSTTNAVAHEHQEPQLPATENNKRSFNLEWNHDAEQTVKKSRQSHAKSGDGGLLLADLLLSLRDGGCIVSGQPITKEMPTGICNETNTSYLQYCIEFINFVGSTDSQVITCINLLGDRTITDKKRLRDAAEFIANKCSTKLSELDDKLVRKKTAIGMGARIRKYKNEIVKAKLASAPQGSKFTVETVALMERAALDKLKREAQPGTPEWNTSIRSFTEGGGRNVHEK